MNYLFFFLSLFCACHSSLAAAPQRALPNPLKGKIVPPAAEVSGLLLEELLGEGSCSSDSGQGSTASDRILHFSRLFPSLPKEALNAVLDRAPILLTIQPEDLSEGVERMKEALPFCDPSYVLQQHVAGVDLLLYFTSLKGSPPNSPMDTIGSQMEAVAAVLGLHPSDNATAITQFLRRCPFAILPKYCSALQTQLRVLESTLSLSRSVSISTVMKFPILLELDLPLRLQILNSSLAAADIPTSTAQLTRIVRTVPRVLMQDVGRRIENLKQLYPKWELARVVREYPRVLTHKYTVLDSHYQVSFFFLILILHCLHA